MKKYVVSVLSVRSVRDKAFFSRPSARGGLERTESSEKNDHLLLKSVRGRFLIIPQACRPFYSLKIFFCHRQLQDDWRRLCRQSIRQALRAQINLYFPEIITQSFSARQRRRLLPGPVFVGAGQKLYRPVFVCVRLWQKVFCREAAEPLLLFLLPPASNLQPLPGLPVSYGL